MELREFAEQILFATTLEEKLRCPETITDANPGAPISSPELPGRPADLRFKPRGTRQAEFPGLHSLDQAHERGRLLHFFANHELLATELMALVLLRFPDAPAAFRRGVLQTLKDEQLHTRLYLHRMQECGVAFGELPVSGFFWRAVAPMENPIDYVAGLSLTFEQANLDFCRQFARGFEMVGDSATSALLDKIYRDEIGHVAYGLKWFRRWKNPDDSDWAAFCRQLKFPLSPQRAKGISLNVEGRQAAGFDRQFIAELNVYSQSKGRTPSVFVFNPFAEGHIAQGKSFTPKKHQRELARDLANLPQYLCRQDDIVLTPAKPSIEFLSTIKDAGFPLPEFVELAGEAIGPASTVRTRKIGKLRPWAWGPDSLDLLQPLFGNVTGETRSPEQRFNPAIAQLYSKSWSARFLRTLLSRRPAEPWLCGENEIGVTINSLKDAFEAIATIRNRGHQKVVVKEALGLAGHNALRLWEPELLEPQRRWIASTLAAGRELVIEPWLEREFDFSVQLEMRADGLKVCGYTGLATDLKGQFQANWAEANYEKRIPANVISSLASPAEIFTRIHQLYAEIFEQLETELRDASYVGPLGIDAFVYRASDGVGRLKPIVEINPRYTMGRLTVELMKRTCPGGRGIFRIVNRATLRGEGFAGFVEYARALRERHPLRLEGEPVPRIRQGAICLNDPATAQVCLALFEVGPH